jgi:hypothetical protein
VLTVKSTLAGDAQIPPPKTKPPAECSAGGEEESVVRS